MANALSRFSFLSYCAGIVLIAACANESADAEHHASLTPASDPDNAGGWVLREDISDEFDGSAIDQNKWFVQGHNDEYYIWKGRAPSQFAAHNVIVEDGLLKLRSQWEPDFEFAVDEGHEGNTYRTHEGQDIPVTTAGIISRKRFLNGYMEARTKAGDAAMTSSFWMIGYESELDVYEQMGAPKLEGNITATNLKMTVHDWSPPAVRPTKVFTNFEKLPYRVADEFHVYGVEWGVDYMKLFLDGKEIYHVTQAELGEKWVLTNPLEVWLDSEIFVWLGWPEKSELPVDFEVDYMRVWQKPDPSLLDRAFFGFEGPILYEQNPRPLMLVPESSAGDDYQKFWLFEAPSAPMLSLVRHEQASRGTRSLKYSNDDRSYIHRAVVRSPAGSLELPAGALEFRAQLFITQGSETQGLSLDVENTSGMSTSFDLAGKPTGQWTQLSFPFSQKTSSGSDDAMKLTVIQTKAESLGGATLYLDDISIVPAGSTPKSSGD